MCLSIACQRMRTSGFATALALRSCRSTASKIAIAEHDCLRRPLRKKTACPAGFAGNAIAPHLVHSSKRELYARPASRAFVRGARWRVFRIECPGRRDPRLSRGGTPRRDGPARWRRTCLDAGRRTRPTICRYKPIFRVGRARIAAADVGHVPPLGQHHAVGDDVDLAGGQLRQDGVALGLGMLPSRCAARAPDLRNSSRMCSGMRTSTAKADGLAALAVA